MGGAVSPHSSHAGAPAVGRGGAEGGAHSMENEMFFMGHAVPSPVLSTQQSITLHTCIGGCCAEPPSSAL